MNTKFEELVDSFIDNKVGLSEHFLTAELAKLLQGELKRLDEAGLMLPAGIGNSKIKDPHQEKRGDKIYWLDKDNDNSPELAFLQIIENFILYLNETCYTGINAYEFHYALYDAGSRYLRHKDQFKNNQDRKYSLIIYLNDDWEKANGGALMIYGDERTETILPTARKAVFFQSNEMEHEVLVADRPRMSITGWLKSSRG